ncbi:hypothetical protein DFH01_09710 [Falsiroseomonas bella]|uniref:Ubiquitin-like domain-containing protein n=1 Tax=Falsiroseomonas bella TaxID=2184016 RepID=A0A317FDG8_9PROT|nr:hypothetical protein [Falsiroseomonas bella]PWS37134.1 hypothetical protein DFH01_09710 [Falsiroseomonas bella]
MSDRSFFVHRAGSKCITEVTVSSTATVRDVLRLPEIAKGAVQGDDLLVFIDEQESPAHRDVMLETCGAHGGRIHLVRCKKVEVRVYFMDREACRAFPPGTRLKKVKEWAVREFGLAAGDAIEHLLQIHGSTDRPNSATPLSALLDECGCSIAFDFVPDVRVEG